MKPIWLSSLIFFFFLFTLDLFGQNHSFTYASPACNNGGTIGPLKSGNFVNGGTYSAIPSGLSLNASTGNINTALSTPGTYVVTYTCVCANPPVTATIQINAIPLPITVTGNTICSSSTNTQYTLQANSATPGTTFLWQPFNSPGSTYLLPVNTINTFTVIGSVNGCTTQVVSSVSTVTALNPVISGPTVGCVGQPITLSGSAANNFTWSTGDMTPVMTDTPAASGPTVYTVYSTNTNNCIGSKSFTVNINNPPNIFIQANSTLCAGYAYVLTASGASTYTWSTGFTTPTFTTIPTKSVSTYTVVGAAAGCTAMAAWTVSWVPLPVLSIIAPSVICAATPVTFTSLGADSYTWNNGAAFSDQFQNTYFFSPATLTLSGIEASTGCATSITKTIPVAPRPIINVSPLNYNLCSGKSVVIIATGNSTVYNWSTGAQGSTISLSPDTTTIYMVQGISASGCSDTRSFQINVFPTPTVTVNSPTVCSGRSFTLEGQSPGDPTLSWSTGAQGPILNVSALFSSTKFTVTATDPVSGCKGNAVATVSVLASITPSVSFKYQGPYCTNSANPLPVLGLNFRTGGTFSSLSELPVDPSTGQINLANAGAGVHTVLYMVDSLGCVKSNSSAAVVVINQSIQMGLDPLVEILPGENVTLNPSGDVLSYNWSPTTDLDCTNCPNPTASPTKSTLYCVSSSQPCVSGACILVEVLCVNNGDLSLPNAFTPNRDGKNDKFCLQGWAECSREFNIMIFDRWGQMVYQSQNPNFCWDGTKDGDPLPTAVYMYVINAALSKDAAIKKTGNISLIK